MAAKKKTTAAGTIINRKAQFNYHLIERFQAGLVLQGSEVKSLRAGKANMSDAYATIRRGSELWLLNCHISPYAPASYNNHEPTRPRKLLLHAHELERLIGKIKEKGLTIIPTRLYFNERGLAKCEIALASGKTRGDKRETTKKREAERETRRALKR